MYDSNIVLELNNVQKKCFLYTDCFIVALLQPPCLSADFWFVLSIPGMQIMTRGSALAADITLFVALTFFLI